MKIKNLLTNEINQNGYNTNILTKNKIGFLYITPVKIIPEDCLACDGYVLKIEDYTKLYEVIGKTFNNGEELSDEFRIPDYNISGRFLQPGTNASKKIEAGLPNITGTAPIHAQNFGNGMSNGALYIVGANHTRNEGAYNNSTYSIKIDASRSSSIYGKSTTVQPQSQIIHVCIRYK